MEQIFKFLKTLKKIKSFPTYADFKPFFYMGQYCVYSRQQPVVSLKVSPGKDNVMLVELP